MLFRRNVYWVFAFSVFLAAICCPAFAQFVSAPLQGPETIRKINLPIEAWLSQGERTEIPWKVSLSKPVLTFQLRSLVRVTADLQADLLQKQSIKHDLHFMVKVSPDGGPWEEGESYTHFQTEKKLDTRSDIQMLAELYLQSGTYTIATIAYDAISGKKNLSFNRIQISAPDPDPLPELLNGLPKIQFLPPPDNAAPLGPGHVSLPVTTVRPVQLDLIVDLSTYEEEDRDMDAADTARMPTTAPGSMWPPLAPMLPASETASQQTVAQSLVLETASVLSAIDLKQGCIQVTALDVLRRRTILPPTSASNVDWDKIRDEIRAPDKAMISVADLKGRQRAGKFFQEEVEKRMTQPPCKLDSAEPLHMIAILSRGVSFPSGSNQPKIESGCNCKVIYLQKTDGFHGADNLKNMLKPLSPKLLQFGDPEDFRRKLFEFTQTIKRSP